jgi:hypothetical protein
MSINEDVDMELREARTKLIMTELSLKSGMEDIDHIDNFIPYKVLAEILMEKSRTLIRMYKAVRNELEPLKYHPKIIEDYLSLGDAYFDFRLTCMNKAKRLSEEN